MQVTLVCILCEPYVWPFVEIEILVQVFVHPRNLTVTDQTVHLSAYVAFHYIK